MLRISKMTDYGTMVLARLAQSGTALSTAGQVAAATRIAPPTVSKLLKTLHKAGLVSSERGPNGGYILARPADKITAADIIDALEGPFAITECSSADSHCHFEHYCPVGGAWQQINIRIRDTLRDVTLADLGRSAAVKPIPHRTSKRSRTDRDIAH